MKRFRLVTLFFALPTLLVVLAVSSACGSGRVVTVLSAGPARSATARATTTAPGGVTNARASSSAPTSGLPSSETTVDGAVASGPPASQSLAPTDAGSVDANANADPNATNPGGNANGNANASDQDGGSTTVAVAQSVSPTSVAGPGPGQAKRAFTRFGYPLTDADASCIAGAMDAKVLAGIDRADLDVPSDAELVAVVTALARCEPTSYVNEQVQSLVGSFGISADQGQCVTKAADKLAAANAKVAAVMLDDWSRLEQPWRDNLLAVVVPCVGDATARTIVNT